jgi:hypothetical protein
LKDFPELLDVPRYIVVPIVLKEKAVLKVQSTAKYYNKMPKSIIMDITKKLYKLNSKKMMIAFNVKAFDVEMREEPKVEEAEVSHYLLTYSHHYKKDQIQK